MSIGEYNKGNLKENQLRVSPSGVKFLLENTPHWINENVLGNRNVSNKTNMDAGTAFHYMIEKYYENQDMVNVVNEALEWLEKEGHTDTWEAEEQLTKMFDVWVNEFPKTIQEKPEMEQWVEFEPNDKIMLSGTVDAIFRKTKLLIDWKTSGSRKKDIKSYKSQMYLYAWLLRQNGCEINKVGACVVKRPARRKKPTEDNEVFGDSAIDIIIEPIDEDYMSELIQNIKERIKLVEMAHSNELTPIEWLSLVGVPDPYDRGNL